MKRKNLLSLLLAFALILSAMAGCGNSNTDDPSDATDPPPATTTPAAGDSNGADNEGNLGSTAAWFDSLGEPQYGGTLVFASNYYDEISPDIYNAGFNNTYYYLEPMFMPDWGVDRNEYSFSTNFVPEQYFKGCLAESYEWIDDTTLYVYLRDNIYWQDKEPVNGRQFVAHDVVYHYSRMMGIGEFDGQEPSAYSGATLNGKLDNVEEIDDFTVAFYFKEVNATNIYLLLEQDGYNYIMCPEVVEMGVAGDWDYAVGTGPWILTKIVSNNSFTFDKNPNYWGYDERYPENRLPYADQLKVLSIIDSSTLVSYLRSGEVGFADMLSYQQVLVLSGNENVVINELNAIATDGLVVNSEYEPFSDVRVRTALQMAIDRDTIAKQYYGLDSVLPAGWVNPRNSDFAYTYKEWPDELKAEYEYNPQRAMELLEEAGYAGLSFTATIGSDMDIAMIEIIQSYLLAIGVEMKVETYDYSTVMSLLREGKFQATWQRNTASGATPWNVLRQYETGNASNNGNYSSEEYDALVAKALSAKTSEELAAACKEMDQMIIEEHWGIRLFPSYIYNVSTTSVSGYSGESLVRMGSPGGWFWARMWTAD